MTDGHTPDLIERIERATGPDRRLNADLLLALGWFGDKGGVLDPKGNRVSTIPDYLGSLDAAMTLIPDKAMCDGGWRVEYHHDLKKRCHATIWLHEHAEPGDGWFTAWGATPALALCVASLKARAIP